MADTASVPALPTAPLVAVSPFAALAVHAALSGSAGVTVLERRGLGLATVTLRRGVGEDAAERLRKACGLDLVPGPKWSLAGETAFVATGPRSFLAVQPGGGWRFAADLAHRLGGIAAVADQSSGYGVLRLSGPRVREVLAKGVPIDLDPVAFGPGDAAVTLAGHVGIVLWQVDATPAFDVAVFRSFAADFWHWLQSGAAEFGLSIAAPQT